MSRFLYRNLELLEPYEGKLSCTVLRGESSRKGADLPDQSQSVIFIEKHDDRHDQGEPFG